LDAHDHGSIVDNDAIHRGVYAARPNSDNRDMQSHEITLLGTAALTHLRPGQCIRWTGFLFLL